MFHPIFSPSLPLTLKTLFRKHPGSDADKKRQRPGLQLRNVRAGSAHSGLWQPGPDKAAFRWPAGPAEWQDPGRRRPVSSTASQSRSCPIQYVQILKLSFPLLSFFVITWH